MAHVPTRRTVLSKVSALVALAGGMAAPAFAIDYADGLVRVCVQSAIPHPEAAALLREYMTQAGLPVPPAGRTLDSICITEVCR